MTALIKIKKYLVNNELQEAFKLMNEVESDFFYHWEYWNLRGLLSLIVGEYQTALKYLQKSLIINPENADVFYNYAYAHENLGNIKDQAIYYGLAYHYTDDLELKNELKSKYESHIEHKEVFKYYLKGDSNPLERPLVSIIIPTYNQKNFLKETLESALDQDYPNLEVIVGDDCSTDGTYELMKKYLHYPGLKYIRREKNLGPGNNSQDLLYNHCSSKYVLILNHDDYFVSESYIQESVALLRMYPNLSMVWANCYIKDEGKATLRATENDLPHITNGFDYFINYETGNYKHITGVLTTLFDRDKALELWCLTEKTKAKDMFLMLKLMLAGDVGFIKEHVSVYRIHKNSISFNMPIEYDYTTIDELEKLYRIALEKGFSKEDMDKWLISRLASYFRWRLNNILETVGQVDQVTKLINHVLERYPILKEYLMPGNNIS